MKWDPKSPYIKIVTVKKVDRSYNLEDNGKFKSILGLEYRTVTAVLCHKQQSVM